MKQHQLTISARPRPEMVERLLRVVRHRGFQLSAIHMESAVDCQELSLTVTVTSTRPIELLQAQLAKLIDVIQVEVAASELAPAAALQIRA